MLVYPRMLKNDDALQLGFHFQGDGAGKMKLKNNGSFFFFFLISFSKEQNYLMHCFHYPFFIHRTRCALKPPHIIIHAFQLPVLKAKSKDSFGITS